MPDEHNISESMRTNSCRKLTTGNGLLRLLLVLLCAGTIVSCNTDQSSQDLKAVNFDSSIDPVTNRLLVSNRVDTTNANVEQIVALYENYLNGSPDSLYDNPYWNEHEKRDYEEYDFSRISLFTGITAEQLRQIYTPFVLSVEPVGQEEYVIKVLFSNAQTHPAYAGSRVWCIHKVLATLERGEWKLKNYINHLTTDWTSRDYGVIRYIYPPTHAFDSNQALKAVEFCQTIIDQYNTTYDDSFNYYLAANVDQMGELENFDYYFAGITTGKAREGMILASRGDEFYPHEFVHKLLKDNPKRGYIIEEGLATFLGTREDKEEYNRVMRRLAGDYLVTESYTFEEVYSNRTMWRGYPVAYPAGAAICEVVYGQAGVAGLQRLSEANTTDFTNLMNSVSEITKLPEAQIEKLVREVIYRYD